jgi:uncharacterized protein with HEPN domain
MRLDEERLEDILEAIDNIKRHLPETWEAFDRNELVRVWCLRHIEIIGEAAAKLSQEARDQAPDVPWKPIIGMRNTLIHAYFDVNWWRVWEVVAKELQPLEAGVRRLLGKLKGEKA